jgi:RHS repeat-associated protein
MLAEERIAQMGLARTTPRVKENCDGVVNGYDIDPFVLAITNPAEYHQEYPDCDIMRADLNGDGLVNGYDISYLTGVMGASATTFDWDAENRLTAVYPVSPGEGDHKIEFKYDYLGRRIEKSVYDWASGDWSATPSEVRRFVWAGPALDTAGASADRFAVPGLRPDGGVKGALMLMEVDGSNQAVRKYTWGLDLAGQSGGQGSALPEALEGAGGIGGLLAVEQAELGGGTGQGGVDAGDYVFAYDGNGNVVQVLDWAATSATAAIVAKYEYDPYGNVVASGGDYVAVNPLRFSTKYWDDWFGLGYWGYRWYSAVLGRWISWDPAGEKGSVNPYLALNNAPALWVDPDGLAVYQSHPTTGPTSKPSKPADLCKLLGGKNCDPQHVPPGPVDIPVNLGTVLKLGNACGHIAFKLTSCKASLKWEDHALFGGKPCDQIRVDPCSMVAQYATGERIEFPCMAKDGITPDPHKQCCGKAKFSGSYDVHIPVSLSIPVGADADGKNSGVCSVTGTVDMSLRGEGEVGQCQTCK